MSGATEAPSWSVFAAARAAGDRDALVADGVTYTWAALGRRVAAACAVLDGWALPPGARVALRAGNRVETVVALLAFITRGVAFVPIHPRLTPAEAGALVADAEPARVLDDADLAALAVGEAAVPEPGAEPDPRALLAMLYTSGTTGRPKGAMLPRGAFAAAAAASARNLGWRDDDRWLACMPLCHVGGLSILTRCLLARRCVVLEPRFDPREVLAAVARERVTLASVVPTMLAALLQADTGDVLRGPRAVLVGGAAAPRVLMAEAARRGVRVLATYGLTEACSQVTAQAPRAEAYDAPGSGRALDGVTLAVVDDAGGALPCGAVGRIRVRGPAVMAGYWRQVPRTAEQWLDTGDLGALDPDGTLHVHARRTDLIVTGGENVYPVEVEQALESLPGVAQALVFGVQDDTWGQMVAAALVAAEGTEPMAETERALAEAMTAVLAGYKRPRRVCWVDALPMRATGKVDRAEGVARFSTALRPWVASVRPAGHPRGDG